MSSRKKQPSKADNTGRFPVDNTETYGGEHESEAERSEIEDVLEFLGLTAPEVNVYKTLLELGSRPAGMIAQRAGLKRGHTYNVLTLLMDKGIVQEFTRNNIRHFTSSAPAALLSMVEGREMSLAKNKERLLRIIPKLEQIRKPGVGRPRVRFFQGVEGVKEIYEEMLREEQDIYSVLDEKYSWWSGEKESEEWLKNFRRRRNATSIAFYGMFCRSSESDAVARENTSLNRELRELSGIELPISIYIFGKKVAIISTRDETVGLLIEHPIIAESLLALFKTVWPFLPVYKI